MRNIGFLVIGLRARLLVLIALVIGIPALTVAACSGGHQSVTPVPAQIPQSAGRSLANSAQASEYFMDENATNAPLVTVTASVVVTIPTSASAAKSISTSVNGATPVIANLSSGSPGCSGSSPVVCTISVSAPTSSDVFAFKTFSGSSGSGTVLATGSVFQTITTTSKTVKITLAGTPSAITVALKSTAPFQCNGSTTIQLFVMVMDNVVNVIIGGYGKSVALTDSDASGKTSLTLTSVSSSASTVNVKYNGLPLAKAIFSASASGVPASSVHPATLKPAQLVFVGSGASRSSGQPPFVFVFPSTANGNVAPLRSMSWSGEDGLAPIEIAVDSNCTLYATRDTTVGSFEIDKFPTTASGTATPSAALGGNLTHLSNNCCNVPHVAVDSTGKIYVANALPTNTPSPSPEVEVFAAGASGNVAPVATISGSNTGLSNPWAVAIDASGKIYVLDRNAPSVLVFAAGANGNVSPVATITSGFTLPVALALDSAGRIYVFDTEANLACFISGAIDVFAAGANGRVAPIRQIIGSNTLLTVCQTRVGIAVDSAGNIYVTNWDGPTQTGTDPVLVFSSTANGNVAPRQILSGSNTKMSTASGIAL